MSAIRSYQVEYVIENQRTSRRNQLTTVIFAESIAEVRRSVSAKGGKLVKAREQRTAKLTGTFSGGFRQQLFILRQLVNHFTVRQSPAAAMHTLVTSEPPARRLALTPAAETLARGGTLAEALRVLKLYKEPILRLIEAGERTNTVRDAVSHAIALLESQRKLANQIYAALGWIFLDIMATVSSISYLHLRFLPDMASQGIQTNDIALRADFDNALNLAIMVNAVLYYGQFMLAIGGYALYMLYIYRDKYRGRLVDTIENLPFLRTYLLDSSLAQSFGTLSRILKTGMHLPAALVVAAQSANCESVRKMMRNAKTRVEHGDSIGTALDRTILDPGEQLELADQPSTEALAETCGRIAEAREDATKTSNRRLVTVTVMLSIGYASLSALTFLWVLIIQNKAQMESLNNLGFH